ncbi:MAG: glutamate 5-kinase [Bacteriovoracaceae bacterium]|jgi:glutamate 5-kinase
MATRFRKHLKFKNKLIIIKLSSLAVTHAEGGINKKQIASIVNDINKLRTEKKLQVIIVSSGSINAGKKFLGTSSKNEISQLQACSAIGQPILMQSFQSEFDKYKIQAAQVLLTHEDLKNKSRSFNVRASIQSLLRNNIIPIINENDSVSFDEITVGDNDQLSAMICEITNADALLMLTQSDGLYNMDPIHPEALHFPIINYSDDFNDIKLISKSSAGRGGMKTKLQAVRKLTPLGINVIISTFSESSPILRSISQGAGSLFLGNPSLGQLKKKSWILTRVRNHAIVKVDSGAKDALLKNASLLPIGIISVSGNFSRGDSIQIKFKNEIIAFGITEYSSKDIEKIKRLKSGDLASTLGYVPSKVVIHKDNLIIK